MKRFSKKWLFVPVFGILNILFIVFAIICSGGGDGYLTPIAIATSPLMALAWLLPPGAPALFILLVPFYWMSEVVLALRRNTRCKWAFLTLVVVKYIFTIIFTFFWNTNFQRKGEIDALLFVGIPYILVQLLLWTLFLHTWGRIRFVIRPAEPPSF